MCCAEQGKEQEHFKVERQGHGLLKGIPGNLATGRPWGEAFQKSSGKPHYYGLRRGSGR